RKVKGFNKVEYLIINDGSADDTVAVAKKCGVHHIVSYGRNRGLAYAFKRGIDECIRCGADVIVNTDADNQYNADDIPLLTAPILRGEAEIVIGARPISDIGHFSPVKKILQKLGSLAVRMFSNTTIADAPSGFRAFSRDAAMQLNVFNFYTYTLETIIQAGWKNIPMISVPIRVNKDLRPSRLVKSIPTYVKRSLFTIIRMYVVYRPFAFFLQLGILLILAGCIPGIRFLYYYIIRSGSEGHVQSLILAAILIGAGFQSIFAGFMVDLVSINRRMLEDVQYSLKKIRYDNRAK
ncbi:MAG TPA: glycosyltransferase family 2 protein, partial [Spirochaetota bacterium]|nr:glycosyltransferase family 2 protein [Spirochaetota bacterium]